jgi:hypothetical protein
MPRIGRPAIGIHALLEATVLFELDRRVVAGDAQTAKRASAEGGPVIGMWRLMVGHNSRHDETSLRT